MASPLGKRPSVAGDSNANIKIYFFHGCFLLVPNSVTLDNTKISLRPDHGTGLEKAFTSFFGKHYCNCNCDSYSRITMPEK